MDDAKGRARQRAESPLGHPGELEMRERLPSAYQWDEGSLAAMMSPRLSLALASFIEAQPFFFLATADNLGHCDSSFRGREYDASGNPLPTLKVLEPETVIFPDFSGNGLYNSLGNIHSNPHVGLLFVDFARQRRARVNGRATIIAADEGVLRLWPQAQAAVLVHVEQAYGNCPARIPRMQMFEGSDRDF